MTFVILKEFYLDRQSEYFVEYAKRFTDLPFAVVLKKDGDRYVSHRFLRASDLGLSINNAEWKTAYFDDWTQQFVVPNGSIGFRWNEEGRWNLKSEDSLTGSSVDPLLTFGENNHGWVPVGFPYFGTDASSVKIGAVPVRKIQTAGSEFIVTTVFDLLVAHMGIGSRSGR